MRSIFGVRGRFVPAALFLTLLAGLAGAAAPADTVEVLGALRADRGPATVPDKTGPTLDRSGRVPLQPRAMTSNQYPGEVEPNDTAPQATPLGGTAAAREGNIFGNGDVDFWSFTGAAGDRVYAATMTSLSGSASVDSTLDLIGTDGTTVIETDADDGSFGATSSSIAGATLPAAGTYYLRVRHAAATNQLRPYRLFFQLRSGAPAAETEPNDTAPGQALPAGGWVSGATSSATDADFYALSLNAGDTVFLSLDLDPERDATEWNASLGLGGFGTPPVNLVVNDPGAATPDSEAFFLSVKDAGTYGILVGLPTGGTTFGSYHLSVTVFPRTDEGANCTTYTSTNVPVTIPGGPGIVTSTLTVPGNPRIEDIDVAVNITHTFMADLDVQLTAPGGNTVGLFSDIGSTTSGAQTTMDAIFDDEGAIPSLFAVTQGLRLAPELNYRLSWFDGQPAGGTWTLTLRDDASGDGGTLNNWSIRICQPPPPPICPPGFAQTTVISTDFEADAGGFTHSGTADEWERGLPSFGAITNCASGSSCWKTDLDNTYDINSDQTLLSPAINLAGLSPPIVVSWAQKFNVEAAQFDTFSIDVRQVGVPANAVRLFQHLGATMTDNVGNPSTAIEEAAGWGQMTGRIDALAGQNVEFAARLTSDSTVVKTGLAIDDFSVTACRALDADLSVTKTDGVTTAVPGGSTTYTITASNAGPSAVTDATVADTFPAALTCTWTCVGAGGGTCTASGAGNINDTTVDLPAAGSVTYTASCAISAAATGTLSNTATVSSSTADPDPANNSATDTDTLTRQADLSITKTDGVTSVIPGGTTTYTITTSNAGPSNAPGATVTDNLPPQLIGCTWTCVGAGGGTCTASSGGNISDVVNLPAGGSVTHSLTCPIQTSLMTQITNTATVTAPAGVSDPTPGNNSATDTNMVQLTSDMRVTKTANTAVVPAGGQIIYTITASNAGPSNTTTIVTDTFPPGLTCFWTCSGNSVSCPAASGIGNIAAPTGLAAGLSAVYTATCTVSAALPAGTVLTNTASAPSGLGVDPTPNDATATHTATVIAGGNLSITKTDGVATVFAGGSTTYTIVARNSGPSTATGATVTDTFPSALTCTWTCVGGGGGSCAASGTGTIADTITLPANGTATYTAVCAIAGNASGSITNTATIAIPSGFNDGNPADNSATDVDSIGQAADLAIVKTSSGNPVYPNGAVVYTVVASNNGPSPATGVSVSDPLPSTSRLCSWSCTAAGGATCAAAATGMGNLADTIDLPVGGTATYQAACIVAYGATGSVSNTATIASALADPNPANNSSTATDTLGLSADLSIGVLDHVETIVPGATLTYDIIAYNAGPSPAMGALVTDTFPALCLSPTWTCTGVNGATCPPSGSGNMAVTVDLPRTSEVRFVATCTVDPAAPYGSEITNWARVMPPDGTIDPDGRYNASADSVTVVAAASVSATKTVSGSLTSGGDAIYTIVLSNGGGQQNDNPGDEFVDVLPPQLALVSASASSGTATADVAGNTVRWNGAIAAGGSVTITIRSRISTVATGAVSNQGTVFYDSNADGTNDSTALTDDPSVGGAGNATVFGIQLVVPVPGLGIAGMLLLALGLGVLVWRRRRAALR